MEFPRRIITSTHSQAHGTVFWEKRQVCHHLAKIHKCPVSPRSTREQRAHYLVHQFDSKTKLNKHTTLTSYRCLALVLGNLSQRTYKILQENYYISEEEACRRLSKTLRTRPTTRSVSRHSPRFTVIPQEATTRTSKKKHQT